MSEPRTEAGRAAQYEVPHFETCAGMRGPNACDCGVVAAILAIEAEARAQGNLHEALAGEGDIERAVAAERARLAEARTAIVQASIYLANGDSVAAHAELAAVLALLGEPE